MKRLTACAIIVAILLAGCSDSLQDQMARLEKFVNAHQYGSSKDVWLIKKNAFGDFEKVALVFGFMSDREFCEEVADLYMKKYPADKYICFPAN